MRQSIISFTEIDLKNNRFSLSLDQILNIVNNINVTFDYSVWLAGGAIRSVVKKENINDFDVFFKHVEAKERFKHDLTKYYGFKSIYQCPFGYLETLVNGSDKVQLITPIYFDNVEQILDSFDFTAAQFASDGTNLFTTKQAIKHVMKKELVLWRITHPISTMRRITKYTNRGYSFSEDQRFLFLDHVARNRWNWDLRWYID